MTDVRMKSYITEEIENLTDEELNSLINSLNQMKIIREKEKREKLIDEFKKAWENLHNSGIDILIDEGDTYLCWSDLTFY